MVFFAVKKPHTPRQRQNNGHPAFYTLAPIEETAPQPTAVAEWIRLPRSGTTCPRTGLSRSILNQLVLPCKANDHRPPVKSIALRKPGAIRGCRLIHLASLLQFLEQVAVSQGNQPAKGGE